MCSGKQLPFNVNARAVDKHAFGSVGTSTNEIETTHCHFTTKQDITKFRVKNQRSYCKLQQNPHNQSLINAPEYHWKVTHGRKSELLGGPEGFSEVVHFQGVKECSRLWSGAG